MSKRPPLVSIIAGSIVGIAGGVIFAASISETPARAQCVGSGVIVHVTDSSYVDPDTAPDCYTNARFIHYNYLD